MSHRHLPNYSVLIALDDAATADVPPGGRRIRTPLGDYLRIERTLLPAQVINDPWEQLGAIHLERHKRSGRLLIVGGGRHATPVDASHHWILEDVSPFAARWRALGSTTLVAALVARDEHPELLLTLSHPGLNEPRGCVMLSGRRAVARQIRSTMSALDALFREASRIDHLPKESIQ